MQAQNARVKAWSGPRTACPGRPSTYRILGERFPRACRRRSLDAASTTKAPSAPHTPRRRRLLGRTCSLAHLAPPVMRLCSSCATRLRSAYVYTASTRTPRPISRANRRCVRVSRIPAVEVGLPLFRAVGRLTSRLSTTPGRLFAGTRVDRRTPCAMAQRGCNSYVLTRIRLCCFHIALSYPALCGVHCPPCADALLDRLSRRFASLIPHPSSSSPPNLHWTQVRGSLSRRLIVVLFLKSRYHKHLPSPALNHFFTS
ncbi:hypothetical protein FB451DRAFT_584772 [Mycena latifolia]|nr:hypothetical protein FB451DRAFT_584772 [Mycena latifolia]